MADDSDDDFDSNDDNTLVSESDDESSSDADSNDVTGDSSLVAKNREREELSRQVEEFLSRGGKINQIDANVCADPPQKPSSNYGSRPI